MAPKVDCPKPPTTVLGPSLMTKTLIANMVSRGLIANGNGRTPLKDEIIANPQLDEVVIFRDFFSTGLWFPMDLVLVQILQPYNMYIHQLTPNSFVRLNL
ncbi:hypothetical protein C2845_PM14G08280 [Panicum miliaceum]|uniref:Uncharacterized protein n=1 Tax=Panicum miliaceum TaxID=4540 RepID=A0A3L6PL94_PANMI|nr:hypothetical protein C2845_PM14G08280 [Panicum miliaceum]